MSVQRVTLTEWSATVIPHERLVLCGYFGRVTLNCEFSAATDVTIKVLRRRYIVREAGDTE
jgi:hypothetical protein